MLDITWNRERLRQIQEQLIAGNSIPNVDTAEDLLHATAATFRLVVMLRIALRLREPGAADLNPEQLEAVKMAVLEECSSAVLAGYGFAVLADARGDECFENEVSMRIQQQADGRIGFQYTGGVKRVAAAESEGSAAA